MPVHRLARVVARLAESPIRTGVRIVAGATLALCVATALPGCQDTRQQADFLLKTCENAIMVVRNMPYLELPPGYVYATRVSTSIQGVLLEMCVFRDPLNPTRAIVQFNCSGPYYPTDLRPVPANQQGSKLDPPGLDIAIDCDELLTAKTSWEYDPSSGSVTASFRAPNTRYMPDLAAYEQMWISVDGRRVKTPGDFTVSAGQSICASGPLDEVAHYAMLAGVTSFSLTDRGSLYTVHLVEELSWMLVFRDGSCIESGPLFAPKPRT